MDGRDRKPDSGRGRVPRCDETRVLLMGYIDGELEPEQIRRVEDHLAVCVECQSEERAYRRLGEVTEAMIEATTPALSTDAAWAGIYSRLERRIGWILTWAGLTLLTLFGAWQLVHDFLLDPAQPFMVRVGTGALVAGGVVLIVSFVRERLFHDRSERYREVQR